MDNHLEEIEKLKRELTMEKEAAQEERNELKNRYQQDMSKK